MPSAFDELRTEVRKVRGSTGYQGSDAPKRRPPTTPGGKYPKPGTGARRAERRTRAGRGEATFDESKVKRDPSGRFGDKPGAGDDAPRGKKRTRSGKLLTKLPPHPTTAEAIAAMARSHPAQLKKLAQVMTKLSAERKAAGYENFAGILAAHAAAYAAAASGADTAQIDEARDEARVKSWNSMPDDKRLGWATSRAKWNGKKWEGNWPGKDRGVIMLEDGSLKRSRGMARSVNPRTQSFEAPGTQRRNPARRRRT